MSTHTETLDTSLAPDTQVWELFPPDKAIGQARLVWRPDEDRE